MSTQVKEPAVTGQIEPIHASNSTLLQILDARDEHARALHELLGELQGDLSDEGAAQIIDDWLAERDRPLKQKLDGYGSVIRERESLAVARRAEAERLNALARADENTVKRLKDRLRWFFEAESITSLETPRFKFSIAQNGGLAPLLVYALPEDLPGKFQKVVISPNNEKIRAALEAGEQLTYAELGPRGHHLRVR